MIIKTVVNACLPVARRLRLKNQVIISVISGAVCLMMMMMEVEKVYTLFVSFVIHLSPSALETKEKCMHVKCNDSNQIKNAYYF
jgi:hypothetical protein